MSSNYHLCTEWGDRERKLKKNNNRTCFSCHFVNNNIIPIQQLPCIQETFSTFTLMIAITCMYSFYFQHKQHLKFLIQNSSRAFFLFIVFFTQNVNRKPAIFFKMPIHEKKQQGASIKYEEDRCEFLIKNTKMLKKKKKFLGTNLGLVSV